VANGYPLLQKIPDVEEPASGYLWGNLAAHGKTYYHFGEYISNEVLPVRARSPMPRRAPCWPGPVARARPLRREPVARGVGRRRKQVSPGHSAHREQHATKPELVGHFAPESPDFTWPFPDQVRVEVFLRHLKQWVADRAQGDDTMPNFVMLRLPTITPRERGPADLRRDLLSPITISPSPRR